MRTTFLLLFIAACGFEMPANTSSGLRPGTALNGRSERLADHDAGRVGARSTLAVDETHVYWTETYAVMRVSRSGGEPELVTDRLFASTGVAIDDRYLYVAADAIDVGPPELNYLRWSGVIVRIEKRSGELEVIAREQADPFELVLAGADLYWMNTWTEESAHAALGQAKLVRMAKSGGSVKTVAEYQDLGEGLWVDGGAVYWSSACNPVQGEPCDGPGDWISGRSLRRFDGERAVEVPTGDDLGVRTARLLDGRITYLDRDGRLVQVGAEGDIEVLSDASGSDPNTLEISGEAAFTTRRGQLLRHHDGKGEVIAEWRTAVRDLVIEGEHCFLLVDGGVERVSMSGVK